MNQLVQKEATARERAQDLFSKEEARKAARNAPVDGDDMFAKITGIKLPSLPSL